jgi:hypothetical protein
MQSMNANLQATPLKGKFIDCNHDIEMILDRMGEVDQERLYELKVDRFPE